MTIASGVPLVDRAIARHSRTAIVDSGGSHTYGNLLTASASAASCLLNGARDLQEARVAFLVPPSFDYAATQWGIWRAGGIAVPLAIDHPRPEMEYVIENAGASVLVSHPQYESKLRPIAGERGIPLLLTTQLMTAHPSPLPHVDPARRAMVLYTSGTTARPKGVVTTHQQIQSQVASLIKAWEWQASDRILLVLPLHHVHGIINVLTCTLWSGAVCEVLPRFDPDEAWQRVLRGDLTLFMAVPTIYVKLIAAWEAAAPERQREMTAACGRLRLMVSGSAALPVPVFRRWQEISRHLLLERYGMTEIGMALSNPLRGERRPGHVGAALPGVEVCLVDESGAPVEEDAAGEVWVRGPGVFKEYWANPSATEAAFQNGWFRTGDVAVVEDGAYRILGRKSVDIIKTGGYKVSALEIEEVLLSCPGVQECAVIGMEDAEWGERVCAVVVPQATPALTLESLREWTKQYLAPYKAPTRLVVVDQLPRNALGKVVKPELVRRLRADSPHKPRLT